MIRRWNTHADALNESGGCRTGELERCARRFGFVVRVSAGSGGVPCLEVAGAGHPPAMAGVGEKQARLDRACPAAASDHPRHGLSDYPECAGRGLRSDLLAGIARGRGCGRHCSVGQRRSTTRSDATGVPVGRNRPTGHQCGRHITSPAQPLHMTRLPESLLQTPGAPALPRRG